MTDVGKPLLPWQGDVVHDTFGRKSGGKWSAYEVGLFEARQNGKGVVIEATELFGLFVLREKQIIHSAHVFDTSRQAFERLAEIIDGSDWLRTRTRSINRSHGDESIRLTQAAGGGELKYKARTKHGVRGFTGDRIVLDEAYGLTVAQMQAMSPVLATLPNAQIIYTSSPPDDKTGPMPADAMAPSIRKRGLAGAPRMAYYEWSPPDGFDPADVDVWYACNPSLGYLIDEDYLQAELELFLEAPGGLAAFATEHLGAWPKDPNSQWLVIGESDWSGVVDRGSQPGPPYALAVATTLDRSHSAIGVCGRRGDGLRHVEVIEHRPGTGWVVPRTLDLVARWSPVALVIDAGGPAASLIPAFEEAGVEVLKPTMRQFGQACAGLYDALCGQGEQAVHDLRHMGQGELDDAMKAAKRRKLGDLWVFERGGSVSSAPLEAVTLAAWGHAMKGAVAAPVELSAFWD